MLPASNPRKSVTFTAGDTVQTVTVSAIGDMVSESAQGETVEISLVASSSVVVGSNCSAVGTITERQNQIVVSAETPSIEYSDSSKETTVRFAISLDSPAAVASTVDWRVVVPGEAPATGMASIAANARAPARDQTATFAGRLPAGGTVSVQLKALAAQGSIPVSAVEPSADLAESDDETVTAGSDTWVVAGLAEIIYSSSSMPEDWATTSMLTAFGRSVAIGLVESVWNRAEAHRSGSVASYARLNGRSIDTRALASDSGARPAVQETARLLGIESVDPSRSSAAFTDYELPLEGQP